MKPELIKTDAAASILRRYPIRNRVFWVGAGADCLPPTGLPASKDLVELLLEQLLLPEYAEAIWAEWNGCMEVLDSQGVPPRMESVLEALKRAGTRLLLNGDKEFSATRGLRFFDDAPSNENTQVLGGQVLTGATVVTTNYSRVVEREASRQSESSLEFTTLEEKRSSFCESAAKDRNDIGKVFHLHGISARPQTMGITLDSISRRFPETFHSWLHTSVGDPSMIFVFFGYSGSDEYDVNPMFESLALDAGHSDNAVALYVRHGHSGEPPTEKEMRLLAPFSRSFICSAAKLNDVLGVEMRQSELIEGTAFDWRGAFEKWSRLPVSLAARKDIADILSLSVSEYFGFNLHASRRLNRRRLEYLRRYIPDEQAWYVSFYGGRVEEATGRLLGGEKIQSGHLLRGICQTLIFGSKVDEFAWGDSPSEVLLRIRDLDDDAMVTWRDATTPNNHWMKMFEIRIAQENESGAIARIIEEMQDDLRCLVECSRFVLAGDFGRLQDLRQVAVEQRIEARALCFLECIANREDQGTGFGESEDLIDSSLRMYQDISNMRGATLALAEKAYIHAARYAFGGRRERDKARSIRALQRAFRLADATKHKDSRRRCVESRVLVGALLGQNLAKSDFLTRRALRVAIRIAD